MKSISQYILGLFFLILILSCGRKSPLDILIDESVSIEYIDNQYQTHKYSSDADKELFKKYFSADECDTQNYANCKIILFQTRSHTIGVKYNTQCTLPYAVYPYEGKTKVVKLTPEGIEKLK